ncbi:MAG: YraN family protein [Phycisphaerae bacterium]|nr:YraN family protein [Tepidisphaeraceae bacterium]
MTGWLTKLFRPLMKEVPPAKTPLGERGENVAAKFLRHDCGYRILTRNFRIEGGEVDVIARDGDTLVFVEVKTRAYDDPTPEEQVNHAKQHQITKAAKVFLSRYGGRPRARFDIVAIVWPHGQKPIIRHTPSAFEATH